MTDFNEPIDPTPGLEFPAGLVKDATNAANLLDLDRSLVEAKAVRQMIWLVDAQHKALEATTALLQRALTPRRRYYLDLDGVVADFDAHFPKTFGVDHRDLADDAMWLAINGHPSYFRDMPPMPGALEFMATIAPLDPSVLTACPKSNYAHVAGQKREWVRQYQPAFTVLPVLGGINKPLFMHAAGDVLIDDLERNTDAWQEAGGIAILHKSFPETLAALEVLNG